MVLERGLYVNIVLPPACHADGCVLRTSYSAAHTQAEIDRAITIFAEVGRTLSVIPAFA
jgi:8-amino-7-oxononanoate synthase